MRQSKNLILVHNILVKCYIKLYTKEYLKSIKGDNQSI